MIKPLQEIVENPEDCKFARIREVISTKDYPYLCMKHGTCPLKAKDDHYRYCTAGERKYE